MAHHFESGFFVREPAWHQLGTVVQEAPSIVEAIKLAGLDWLVEKVPWELDGVQQRDFFAIRRVSDGRALGSVGPDYEPLQNVEAFRFFDTLVAEGDVELDAAGSLLGGRRIWVTARIKTEATVGFLPDERPDVVRGQLLFTTGHDGGLATHVGFTPIRVVCHNTQTAALRGFENDAKTDGNLTYARIPHRVGQRRAIEVVRQAIDVARRRFDLSVEAWRKLAERPIELAQAALYFDDVFGQTEQGNRRVAAKRCLERFEHDPATPQTAWGLVQAVTGWLDHERGRKAEARLRNTWSPAGERLRRQAQAKALALL